MPQKIDKISNFIGVRNEEQFESYINNADRDLKNIFEYLKLFPRQIETSAEPTLSADEWLFWRDTDDDKMYLIWKKGGNQKKVELI